MSVSSSRLDWGGDCSQNKKKSLKLFKLSASEGLEICKSKNFAKCKSKNFGNQSFLKIWEFWKLKNFEEKIKCCLTLETKKGKIQHF